MIGTRIHPFDEEFAKNNNSTSGTKTSGEQTNADLISQMYDSNLASTNASLEQQYSKADSDLLAAKEKNAQTTDQNLNRAAVEGQKAAMNMAQLNAAQGLSSGASAMTRLSLENQTGANMTALRVAQQNADAEIERQRALLAQEYSSAIAKAQADNDLQKAQALYEQAEKDDSMLLAKQEAAAGLMAKVGDFSLYQGLYGLTDEQVKALQNYFTGSTTGSNNVSGSTTSSGLTSNSEPKYIPAYNPKTDRLAEYLTNTNVKVEGQTSADSLKIYGYPVPVSLDEVERKLKTGEVYIQQLADNLIRFREVICPQLKVVGGKSSMFVIDGKHLTAQQVKYYIAIGQIQETFDPNTGVIAYEFVK